MDPSLAADPVGLLAAILHVIAVYFPAIAPYVPAILGYAGMTVGICIAITKYVKPPSASAPWWWVDIYRAISWFAGNSGHARNATPAGMPPVVRDASIVAAKEANARPELTTIAPLSTPSGAPVIVTGAPVVALVETPKPTVITP